jgi:two-component system response regulator AtoC
MNRGKVLVVDDDRAMCEMLEMDLSKKGFEIIWESNAENAFRRLKAEPFEVVLADVQLPEMSGIALCERVAANYPDIPVIVITAFGNMDTVVEALRAGAYDFVSKPIETEQLALVLDRSVKHRGLLERVDFLSRALDETQAFENIIGSSPAMKKVFDIMERITGLDSSVLISGESGTGKELVARALHNKSDRKNRPFIGINCASVPESLLESELFGYQGGAFTGARKAHEGLFVQADGGTLLLDEIGDMPVTLQPKILRAIEQRTVRPIGGKNEIPFDVRIIASTNQDLEEKVEKGDFREDLFYRLNVIQIELPPLRSRGNDILLLADNFLRHYAGISGKRIEGISTPAAERILDYSWPGNVRELRNCIERAAALTVNEKIIVEDLPEKIRAYKRSGVKVDSYIPSELVSMEDLERNYIEHVLKITGGNKTNASRILGFDRKTLYRKIEKLKIPS